MNFLSSPDQIRGSIKSPKLSRLLVSFALISILVGCSPDRNNRDVTVNLNPTPTQPISENNPEPDNFEPNNPEPASQGDANDLEPDENPKLPKLSDEDLDMLGISEDMTKVPPFPENGSKEDFANAIHKAKLTRQLRASADPSDLFRSEMADAYINMLDEYYDEQMDIEELAQRNN